MRKSNSDSSKVRQVLENHGYTKYRLYSESRKNHRRVKAWICKVKAEHFIKVEQELRESFGERFKSCYNMTSRSYAGMLICFVVELAPFSK